MLGLKKILVGIAAVLALASWGPQLSAYIDGLNRGLTPIVHIYRGVRAANDGDMVAAGRWLEKAVGEPDVAPSRGEPSWPAFSGQGDCSPAPRSKTPDVRRSPHT